MDDGGGGAKALERPGPRGRDGDGDGEAREAHCQVSRYVEDLPVLASTRDALCTSSGLV